MRISHWGKFYYPHHGGIENVTKTLAEGASLAGNTVTVICFDLSSVKHTVEVKNKITIVRNPVDFFRFSQPLGLSYWRSIIGSLRYSDLIHVHAPNYLALLALPFVPRRVRVVVHWHSDVIGKGFLSRLLRPIEFFALRRADTIISTSPSYAYNSNALRPWTSKVTIVPIGAPTPPVITCKDLTADDVNIDIPHRKIVLAVGRLVPYKGFDVLITSARYLKEDAIVLIVGEGPLRGELESQITKQGLQNKVYLLGRLSDYSLSSLFRQASVYCMTSLDRAEAFGVVLVEAMSYGLPIVATEIKGSGVPWVNAHNETGLNVPIKDPVATAAACNIILDDNELAKSFKSNGIKRHQTLFSLDTAVQNTLASYKKLISRSD
ncbi:MAG: glycosyltransferase [Limnobacter sp.]|jgi:glycosyltransferase involved in cell wall biosynthesis|uniref:glycosyltransferase n=1 Tax=Limnobacter sp. TaxID=2003368 RepID=UPI0011FA0336|nr:glycosyltransferase [Limnobacter sp.]MDZ4050803.1 glycosyltransferase [Limnobacter sp.]RZO90623.1 MAG: glycosyltransferase [Limnobacter sp.]